MIKANGLDVIFCLQSRRNREHRDPESSNQSTRRTGDDAGDGEFDIKKIKSLIDRMFFRESDAVKRGTVQYDDFWKFYDKIQAIKKKGLKEKLDGRQALSTSIRWKKLRLREGEIEIPEVFSKKHTIPFSLKYKEIEDYIHKLYPGGFWNGFCFKNYL
jgi:regulator of replication initiation timing